MSEATLPHLTVTSQWPSRKAIPAALSYGLAVLSVAVAWVVRLALDPVLGDLQSFPTFYVAVALTAWWAGWRAAVVALVMGYLAGDWFFLPPRYSLWTVDSAHIVELLTYFSVTGTTILLLTSLRRAERRASASAETALREKEELEREITERERAEKALSESEQRFRAIFDQAPIAIALHSLEGRFFQVNRIACDLFGRSREELCGLHIQDVVYEEDWHLTFELLPRLLAGEITRYDIERRYVRKEGSIFWGRADVSLVRDLAGKPSYVIGALVDVTERKEAEEVLARNREDLEQLVQERTARLREMVEELEHFSYSITHDMRAPLRAMQSYATLVEEQCAGCMRGQSMDFFRRIKVASNRMDRLILDSLDYAKILREELPLHPVDLGKLLHGLIEGYPNLHPDKADIVVEGELPTVLGNEAALTHCLSNLLGNAVKFVAAGLKPHIRVWAEERLDLRSGNEGGLPQRTAEHGLRASAMNLTLASSNPVVRLWIEDNGIGIPRRAQEKIFGMFQRLHRDNEYPGTGIGLAIVRKGIQRMGGQAGVESEVGKGSKFWIELPKADER